LNTSEKFKNYGGRSGKRYNRIRETAVIERMEKSMFEWKWMTNDAALEIAEWEYEEPYSFYNLQNDVDDLDEFLNPFRWNHYAAIYEKNELVGFYTFNPLNLEEVEIGLGLRPDLTGKGKGVPFVDYALAVAVKWYDPKKLIVKVAEFNKRALAVYEKAGFQKVDHFMQHTNGEQVPFVRMEKKIL
jgi:[ribosomal protein S18]-alanine N-acetyltransferase